MTPPAPPLPVPSSLETGIILICAGFPYFILRVMKRNQKNLSDPSVFRRYGFLFYGTCDNVHQMPSEGNLMSYSRRCCANASARRFRF